MSAAPDIADLGKRGGVNAVRAFLASEGEPMGPPPGRFDDDDDVPANEGPPVPRTPAPSPWAERVVPCDAAWFTSIPPRRTWLLRDSRTGDGVLPLGKVGLLLAEGGLGKTMALVQLAIAKAAGFNWLGTFTIPSPGKVLAILGEEDAEEVQRRSFNAIRAMRAPVPPPGSIVVVPLSGLPCPMIETDAQGNPGDGPFLVWLHAYLAANGPFELVIVDPLSRFAGPDAEIDNASATRFIVGLESIASATGATVIVAHHVNKSARGAGATVSGASARGSSAIYDGVRWAAALSAERVPTDDPDVSTRLGELVTLSFVKSNYSPKGEPLLLRRDSTNGGALVALDTPDLAMVGEARASANPVARRQAARAEHGRAQVTEVAGSIVDALRSAPGLSGRALHAAVLARRGSCGRPMFEAALVSLGDAITTKDAGRRGATLHYLSEGAP